MVEHYDVMIVGGGPAALTAAIYTGRADLKTLVAERAAFGGQASQTDSIDNYPGFPDGISGPELAQRMKAQAERFGAEFRTGEEVKKVELDGEAKLVTTEKAVYRCRALILSTGADPRKLGVMGEAELRSRGVSYCATCDGPFFRDKKVVVVGGGDAAFKEALFLAKFASEILIVHRREDFRAEMILQKEARENPKLSLRVNSVLERINGERKVDSVDLRDVETAEVTNVPCDGVFIFIGHVPNTGFLCNLFPADCGDRIETDENMMTRVPGVFAVGDVRKGSYAQIATAVGDGATAAIAAEHWLAAGKAGRQ